MNMRSLLFLLAFIRASLVGAALHAETLNLGTSRELFVDHYLVDQLDGVELKMGQPKDEGIALAFSSARKCPALLGKEKDQQIVKTIMENTG